MNYAKFLHEIRQEEQHDWPICAHITIHFEYKKSGFIWEEVKQIRCKLSPLLSTSPLSRGGKVGHHPFRHHENSSGRKVGRSEACLSSFQVIRSEKVIINHYPIRHF